MCVTVALLASGSDCAGPRAMLFNLGFNATLLWQFFGVLEKPKARGSEGKQEKKTR